MIFEPNEEQRQILDLARSFAEKEVAPNIVQFEREERYSKHVAAKLGENMGGFGGQEESPKLVDEMGTPVVESAAAEGGFISPTGTIFRRSGSNTTGPLT